MAANEAMLLLDRRRTVIAVNNAALRIYRVRHAGALLGLNLRELRPASTRRQLSADFKIVERTGRGRWETIHVCPDGVEIHVEASVRRIRHKSGTGYIYIARDITGRKRAEEELRSAKATVQAILDSAPVAILGLDLKGRVRNWSAGAFRIFGWTQAETVGRVCPTVPANGRAEYLAMIRRVVRRGPLTGMVCLRRKKNGALINASLSAAPVRDSAGRATGVIVTLSDITERVRTEEALRRSEHDFRLIFDRNPMPMWVYDPENLKFLAVNDAAVGHYGYTRGEFLGMSIQDIRPKDDLARLRKAVQNQRAGRKRSGLWRHRKKDGTVMLVEIVSHAVNFMARKAVLVLANDVTVRHETEQRFRQLAENIREVFWLTDPAKQQMLYVSPAYEKIWGRKVADLHASPGTWMDAIHPDDRPRIRHAAMSRQATGRYDEEYRVVRPDGAIRWIHDKAFPIRDEAGRIYRIAGVAEDITRRKESEEALRRSEREQRRIAEHLAAEKARLVAAQTVAKVGSWETDLATGAVTWSDETHRIFETDPAVFHPTHRRFLQIIHPDDRVMVDEVFVRSLVIRTPCRIEHRVSMPDGRVKFVEERWQTFFDPAGKPVRAVGTCQDITDRKLAEASLRESEDRFRTIFEQAGIGIALVDPTGGRINRCNHTLAKMLGYEVEQLCARTVQDISHPEDYEDDRAQWQRMLAGEIPRFQMEKRYCTASGQLVWGLLTSTVVRAASGSPLFIIGMVEQISERKQAETALRESEQQLHALVGRLNTVREDEAKRIARELHDDLGQQLTALNMELSDLETRLATTEPPLLARLTRMHGMVDRTIEVVQKISGELRLGQLDVLGLTAAIDWQLKEFSRLAGISCCVMRLDEVDGLPDAQSTALFRILQETLTNVIRHAGASRVEASLEAAPDQVALTIRDNGRGITEAELTDRKAIGLLGMRERAQLVGGTLAISGAAGQGTVVCVSIPRAARPRSPG